MSCEVAHLGNYSIGIFAVHEIVVNAVADFRKEGCLFLIVFEDGWRIVVPKETVAFDGLEEGNHILKIGLDKAFGLVTLRHFAVLQLSQSINSFVFL